MDLNSVVSEESLRFLDSGVQWFRESEPVE